MRSYRERLYVPLLWWLLGTVSILVIGSGIWAGLSGWWPAITYIVLFALVGSVLVNWTRATIEVSDGVLRAGGTDLPLEKAGKVVALDERETRVVAGPRADPAAHLLLRPYLKRAVYIAVDDAESTVPYWLIATRRPEELADAIERSHKSVA
ncbi:MAG: DUF3093 domain-containing protein [Streptosporangiales bacterium]|jgi:hypothetical protein|nr:DUF3093 domain-containing protein [Streptosporangiales bacterium]